MTTGALLTTLPAAIASSAQTELLLHRLHTLHLETMVNDQRKHIKVLTRGLRAAENELATLYVSVHAGCIVL